MKSSFRDFDQPPRRPFSRAELVCAALVALMFAALIALLCVAGCAAVPHPVGSDAPMYDPDTGQPDSGIIAVTTIESATAFEVTPSFQARYQALAEKYGARFTPPLDPAAGFATIDGKLYANGFVMQNLAAMAGWERGKGSSQ
jgi:hypothetical protein